LKEGCFKAYLSVFILSLVRSELRDDMLGPVQRARMVRDGWRDASIPLVTFGMVMLAADAAAYIDPGYGALVQQIVLSGFFGALFLGRKLVLRVMSRITSVFTASRTPVAGERPSEAAAGQHSVGRKG
jgi:hypothetical protein